MTTLGMYPAFVCACVRFVRLNAEMVCVRMGPDHGIDQHTTFARFSEFPELLRT